MGSKWTPVRKIATQIWVALSANASIAAVIAGTDHDYSKVAYSAAGSVFLILAGYFTTGESGPVKGGTPTATQPDPTGPIS